MKIRKSTEQDFYRIMEIYAFAREYMKTHGNPNQWGPTNWPPEELIHNDIKEGNSYVCLNDSEQVIGVFYFFFLRYCSMIAPVDFFVTVVFFQNQVFRIQFFYQMIFFISFWNIF